MVKNSIANAGDIRDVGSNPGSGRSPGGGHGNPLQYSCLENHHGQRSLVGYSVWGCKESDTMGQAQYGHNYRSPHALNPVLHYKRSPGTAVKSSPHSSQLEKRPCSNKDPTQPEINHFFKRKTVPTSQGCYEH